MEKSIDVIAPSNAFVCELEETCINEPGLRFNIPKNMEESKVKFEYKPTFTAQSKRKQEQQDEGHGGQDAFGNIDVSDQRLRWYSVTELSEMICELCMREMQVSKSKVLGSNSKFNPTSCVNCCANWNADTNGVVRSTEGRKLYTRLFAECVVAIPDLQHLMEDVNNVQAMTTIIRELAYSKLKTELSHVGFVSMTMDHAAQFYNNGHGKQLCASRDVITCKNSEGVDERTSIFVVDKDLGNVAYSSWIKSVLDQGTMYDLLGQTTNEESLGDVVEMILGFFEVMSYFQQTSAVERCMEDQEGVRAFNRTTPRREREPHDGPEPKAEQTIRSARGAHKRSAGHHEQDQAQTFAIPDDRACLPRVQEEGNRE